MREVNFSIPNVNKASVNITTTLYDRRALDCTSTLPLINSLNHLAYLTTSSARIRDILTVDGGIERLVCILKEGRSNNLMEIWKWSLAFQCVVNIGVRGSETVRTRVVEADMVPVIATILDNYIRVYDKVRARSDSEGHWHKHHHHNHKAPSAGSETTGRSLHDPSSTEQHSSRRQAPPTRIEIPPFYHDTRTVDSNVTEVTSSPRIPMTSPPERSTFGQEAHVHRSHANPRQRTIQPLATAIPSMNSADGFGLRPVRDTERLPSMLPAIFNGMASQPNSPTTPNGSGHARSSTQTIIAPHQRPTLQQHPSASGESDDANGEDSAMGDDGAAADTIVDFQSRMEMDDEGDRQAMIDSVSNAHDLTVADTSEGQEAETFNITHRSAVDGSLINDNAQTRGTLGVSPTQAANNANSPAFVPSPYSLFLRDRANATSQNILNTMPREEDVLMSLQLLAYVSKYCELRSYFQHSHLVPKLKIDRELQALEEGASPVEPLEEEEDEYLLPDDLNIFPLVERFTVRYHTKDMQYWAAVVMRNLCRKDESRGGIRQCANYKCGKWEEFQRQFAKCRRCRRTKYCSKDCQKAAWVFHRHWCHTTP
ncbi:MYND-type zinc finger protein MUB1 [Aspergillus lucknowensis]|uniref:MYND-type zinc finger protein samB n=1 Tax=Aspergillus lucknowensis TaxID=176173 RepID=A0ABR4LJK2_9EURO